MKPATVPRVHCARPGASCRKKSKTTARRSRRIGKRSARSIRWSRKRRGKARRRRNWSNGVLEWWSNGRDLRPDEVDQKRTSHLRTRDHSMNEHKIIDGDGHVVEDIASIVKYMPEEYVGRSFRKRAAKILFRPSIICIPPTSLHAEGRLRQRRARGLGAVSPRSRHRHHRLVHQRWARLRQDRQPRLGHRAGARLQ
jgi:hypothetical protein